MEKEYLKKSSIKKKKKIKNNNIFIISPDQISGGWHSLYLDNIHTYSELTDKINQLKVDAFLWEKQDVLWLAEYPKQVFQYLEQIPGRLQDLWLKWPKKCFSIIFFIFITQQIKTNQLQIPLNQRNQCLLLYKLPRYNLQIY